MRSQFLLVPAAVALASAPAMGLDVSTMEAAQARLYPNATLIPVPFKLTPEQVDKLKNDYDVPVMHAEVKAWRASTGGWLYLDQVFGLNDIVTYLVAIDDKGAITGLEMLACAEGFCDLNAPEWRTQVVGKKTGKWVPKETFTNISGATLTTLHVSEGMKKMLAINALYTPKKK
jgi:hypothetical protein